MSGAGGGGDTHRLVQDNDLVRRAREARHAGAHGLRREALDFGAHHVDAALVRRVQLQHAALVERAKQLVRDGQRRGGLARPGRSVKQQVWQLVCATSPPPPLSSQPLLGGDPHRRSSGAGRLARLTLLDLSACSSVLTTSSWYDTCDTSRGRLHVFPRPRGLGFLTAPPSRARRSKLVIWAPHTLYGHPLLAACDANLGRQTAPLSFPQAPGSWRSALARVVERGEGGAWRRRVRTTSPPMVAPCSGPWVRKGRDVWVFVFAVRNGAHRLTTPVEASTPGSRCALPPTTSWTLLRAASVRSGPSRWDG